VGRIEGTFETGDHVTFELDVLDVRGSARPLFFQRAAEQIEPGHEA
jgi:hypothetical protein